MELFILWCGFIGAWLLFAGPVYQAALELREQDIERERIHAVSKQVKTPRHVAVWWWLLPPVKLWLESRQARIYQQEYLSLLDPEDVASLIAFMNKAQGWFMVALGGLLLAAKETFELVEAEDWPEYVFWSLLVVLFFVSMAFTIARVRRESRLLGEDD